MCTCSAARRDTLERAATQSNVSQGGILMGFDFGRARIGVAVGNRATVSATALITVGGRNGPDWVAIERLLAEWQPAALVVGVPTHMDGSADEMTTAAQGFISELETRFGLPVHPADERLSSREAAARLRESRRSGARTRRVRKGDEDSLAAQLILQGWMEQTA